MDVEIFRRTVKNRRRGGSWLMLEHMAEGIKQCGDNPIVVNEQWDNMQTQSGEMEPHTPIGVMFGYGGSNQKHHTKGRRRMLADRAKEKGISIITFDGGLLSSFGNTADKPEHHWRVSLYSPMNDGEFFCNSSPPDRWNNFCKLWNVKYEPWRKSNPDDPILFILQPSDNWSMNDMDPIAWFNGVYKKIRPLTKRQFLIRPHPNHMAAISERKKEFPADCKLLLGPLSFHGKEKAHYRYNFQEAITNCHAVITHNSTASTDSCVRGIPTFVTSDLSICWDVANWNLLKIENPIMPDREQWTRDLGYRMWSIDEIRSGIVYKRFKEKLGL